MKCRPVRVPGHLETVVFLATYRHFLRVIIATNLDAGFSVIAMVSKVQLHRKILRASPTKPTYCDKDSKPLIMKR